VFAGQARAEVAPHGATPLPSFTGPGVNPYWNGVNPFVSYPQKLPLLRMTDRGIQLETPRQYFLTPFQRTWLSEQGSRPGLPVGSEDGAPSGPETSPPIRWPACRALAEIPSVGPRTHLDALLKTGRRRIDADGPGQEAGMNTIIKLFETAARADRAALIVTRIGLVVVLVWIGSLKVFHYEAEGIVPLVANSPFMSFAYQRPTGEYRQHMNPAGELVPANREWHERNGTYLFAYGLGTVIVALGVVIALHPWLPQVAAVGSLLVFLMSFVTLSFLVTTPECWVPALGSPQHGFPLLDLPGLLVVKDSIMMGAALVTMADSAKAYLRGKVAAPQAVSQRKLATVAS